MKMTLFDALRILAAVHTRDDDQAGFTINTAALHTDFMPCSKAEYLEAWSVVREQLHQPFGPLKEGDKQG